MAVGRDRRWPKAATDRGRRPWVGGDGGRRPRSMAAEDPKRTRSGCEVAAAKGDTERSVRCFLARRNFGKQPEFDAPRRRNQRRRLAAAAEGRRPLSTAVKSHREGKCSAGAIQHRAFISRAAEVATAAARRAAPSLGNSARARPVRGRKTVGKKGGRHRTPLRYFRFNRGG